MSDRFIMFNDEQLDAQKVMMLQDLTRLLLKNKDTQVKIQKFPYYNPIENILITSSFWAHRPQEIENTGLKTDVMLAAYSYQLMDNTIVHSVINDSTFNHDKLYQQIFKMFEDQRILQYIQRDRPSTKKAITLRNQVRLNYNESQIKVYQTKTTFTDLFFLHLEHSILKQDFFDVPDIHPALTDVIINMYQYLPDFFNIATSEDSKLLADRIMFQIDDLLQEDMLNEYYHIPNKLYNDLHEYHLADIKRTDQSNTTHQNDETQDELVSEDMEAKSQDSESQGGSYLEMELHEGENSEAISDEDSVREGDTSDEITDIASKKGKGSEQTLELEEGGHTGQFNHFELKGINKNVSIEWNKPSIKPGYSDQYRDLKNNVQFEIKDLIQIIKKTIDREYQSERNNLMKGRLQSNLINWFTDDPYKMFYKKQDLSRTFDATFTLLIDASASMQDKMEETKKGVVLFHETLKSLNIKHEILAFNEDAFNADEREQPTIIDEIINYQRSTNKGEGHRIIAMEPQDDNRDGVAIRIASERLLQRSHKQRFLIIFSDGEPSAFNYSQDGILDTYEAVEKARKMNIEIFNVFLSQEPITEAIEQTIYNIYGHYALFVEGVEKLPSHLSPLLKKLLLKSFL
ncbi:VWA domain-containing protein [Staphylococcus sp. SQ8-PEA]|uniref:VWA domain-containing protein n=1 Tax=Staphylococcus marylandisciuri TaxID=2981529 RepID=A0ABT2QNK4_9STAP|nr:VWA domain-containing protein [Staphylococcus marylandisciuri]MCU5745535.1 VWA domain-containing protein [Staphylococcus marylandisciuri]